jgi:hypothetical protein
MEQMGNAQSKKLKERHQLEETGIDGFSRTTVGGKDCNDAAQARTYGGLL